MVNNNQLYYALLCMRDSQEAANLTPSLETGLSSILINPSKSRGIDTRRMSYFQVILPEFINDYAVDIQPKITTESLVYISFIVPFIQGGYDPIQGDINADIVKGATSLPYIFDGSEKWVSQADMFDCMLTRNNVLRYIGKRESSPLFNNLGNVFWESTTTEIDTSYVNGEYVVDESESISSGEFRVLGMSGSLNRAKPRRVKRVVYNSALDEYFISLDFNRTVKLKLVLTNGTTVSGVPAPQYSGIDFIESLKCVYDSLTFNRVGSGGQTRDTIYDEEAVLLINNQFVQIPDVPDFDPPLDIDGETDITFEPNRTIWEYKQFDYKSLTDLLLN